VKSWKRRMYPFVETIRIESGQPCNLHYHQLRLALTMARFFPGAPVPSLKEALAKQEYTVYVSLARLDHSQGSCGI
jgi:hypothetical protein